MPFHGLFSVYSAILPHIHLPETLAQLEGADIVNQQVSLLRDPKKSLISSPLVLRIYRPLERRGEFHPSRAGST